MYGSELPSGTTPEAATRIMRMIVAAMCVGMVLATAVFAFVRPEEGASDPQQARFFLAALGVVGVGCLLGWAIFRRVTLASLRKGWARRSAELDPETDLVRPFFSQMLVGAALSEGPGLMAAVVYFMTGSVLALAGVVVALYALSRFYPRDDGFRRFVDEVSGGGTAPA